MIFMRSMLRQFHLFIKYKLKQKLQLDLLK